MSAAAQLEQVLRLRPDDPAVHNDLGAILARQGHLEEAAMHLQRAVALQPDYAEARANLERLSKLAESAPAARP